MNKLIKEHPVTRILTYATAILLAVLLWEKVGETHPEVLFSWAVVAALSVFALQEYHEAKIHQQTAKRGYRVATHQR